MDHSTINNKEDVKKLLILAIFAGRIMLKNGAEIYRVEDTVERICRSRKNVSHVDAFVTPTGIFLSLEYENEIYTYLRRVKNLTIDLNKIHKVNEFSRCFVSKGMSLDEGMAILTEIKNSKPNSILVKATFGALSASCFAIMYGGSIRDFFACVLVSFINIIILSKLTNLNLTFFIDNFIGAAIASLLSYLTIKIGLGENLDMIIIGSIMYLVPGVSITNAIRDTMSGDYISGQSRTMEAIFSALAIALGVGLILNIYVKGVI